MDNLTINLAEDYLQGAYDFVWAAEKICSSVEKNSVDRLFRMENPVNFLLGHSAELTLKAALAFKGFGEHELKKQEIRHDLDVLVKKCQENGVVFNQDFLLWTNAISENFKNFDHRYSRSFSGYPESEWKSISELPIEERKKIERKYGLVAKSGINPESYIKAIMNQIESINVANPKAA